MASSAKIQSTKVSSSWDEETVVETAEKQMSKMKILTRGSQGKDEPESDQQFKLISDASSVTIVSPEEQNRTQYTPEAKVLIMKRPTPDGYDNAANNKPKQPVKTLEQRQAEYKEARLRILGNAEPDEKKGGNAALNADESAIADAGTSPSQDTGNSPVAQGVQRGIITGPVARQQQQQSKKQALTNGRQNQGKRASNNQQTPPQSQPQPTYANSQFNPCAAPFQHSSLTNGNNANSLHQGVPVSQQQVLHTQPPPMSVAPPTVMMAQQFSHVPPTQYMPGQQYHQPAMGPPFPHGMLPPPPPPPPQHHPSQFVGSSDLSNATYMQQQPQQGAGLYHHPEQQFVPQQQFFHPQPQHYQQMQHPLQYIQAAHPPMPQQQHNHQGPMLHMHQQPMQQQFPPPMMPPPPTFQPPRPQYVQRTVGPRSAFPVLPREDIAPMTNGGSSNRTTTPSPPQQQQPPPSDVAHQTPREKSPPASNNPNSTNSKGNKKANKNKPAKGKAYSTTRNSYTIKQRPKEEDSVTWRVKPAEIVPEQNDSPSSKEHSSDQSPEDKSNGIATPSKNDDNLAHERSEDAEGNNSATLKTEGTESPKDEDLETGSSSPLTVVKAKKKTKRGKKKNPTATALTVAISTNAIPRSNCKDVNDRILRMPKGPDGTKGFNLVR